MPAKSTILKIALITALVLIGLSSVHSQATETESPKVTIKYIEDDRASFEFSIKYLEWRNQIHVRSDKPLRTLVLSANNEEIKAYNIIGSELIILPMNDFTSEKTHRLTATFVDDEQVIEADIRVTDK